MPSIAFSLNNDLMQQPAGSNWGSLIGGGMINASEELAEFGIGKGIKSMFASGKADLPTGISPKFIDYDAFFSTPGFKTDASDVINVPKSSKTMFNKSAKLKGKLGSELIGSQGFFSREYIKKHGRTAYNELMEQTVKWDNFNFFGRSKSGKLLNKAFRDVSETYLKSQANMMRGIIPNPGKTVKDMKGLTKFLKTKLSAKNAQYFTGDFWQKGLGKGLAKTGKVAGKVSTGILKAGDFVTAGSLTRVAKELNLDIASTAWAMKGSGVFGKAASKNLGKIATGSLLTGAQNFLGGLQSGGVLDMAIFGLKLGADFFAARGASINEKKSAIEDLKKYGQITAYQYQDSQAAKAMREQSVNNIMMLKNTGNEARMRQTNPYEFYRLIGG